MPANHPVTSAPRRTRRTQEERTATTRAKVIGASIDCLSQRGFAESTTSVIAEAAGISRGAMVHHFPSKDDLLIAVVEHVLDDSLSSYGAQLMAIADPRERLLATPELAWKGILSPGYMAWLEIWIGTRGNAPLTEKFRATYDRVNRRAAQAMRRMAVDAGVDDLERIERIRMLFLGAMRGLAIEAVVAGSVGRLEEAVAEMRRLFEQAVPVAPPARAKIAGASRTAARA
jgi:AcrR family transcriptional regulator